MKNRVPQPAGAFSQVGRCASVLTRRRRITTPARRVLRMPDDDLISSGEPMSEEPHALPDDYPHLGTVAMPCDPNPSGGHRRRLDPVSKMDLAGATFAVRRSGGRVATVAIDAMRLLRPIAVGDEVSCCCALVDE